MASRLAGSDHRADIDGLRAVAVLGVIAYHAFPHALPGGFSGVDVFFVISGYLITRLLLRDLAAGSFSVAAFYARRIRRLFPALLVVLATCLVAGWFLLLADEYAGLGTHVAGGAGFVSNLVLWSEVGYWDPVAGTKPLLHLWSLGIEEQFYFVWPLLLAIGWRLRRATLALTLVVAAFSLGVDALMTDGFYAPHARLWELLVGAVLAHVSAARAARGALADGMSGLGAALIVAGLVLATRGPGIPVVGALLPTLGTALVIGAGDAAWLNRTVLARGALGFVGRISYPLYLWHWPLLAFLRILEGETPPASHRFAAIGASVMLAALTYRWIEQPIRRGPRRRGVVLALVAAMLLVGGAGHAIHDRDGLPLRAVQRAAPRFDTMGYVSSPGCEAAHPLADRCYATPTTYPETLLVFGDSHAEVLAPALIAAATSGALGMNLLVITQPGCAPFAHTDTLDAAGTPAFNCRAAVYATLTEVLADPKITTVVLVARHAMRATWRGFGDEPDLGGAHAFDDGVQRSTDPAEVYRLGLDATFAHLSTRRLVFIDQVPELGFDPRACAARPFGLGRSDRARCSIARSAVDARQARYRAVAGAVIARHRVTRIDPMPLFSDAERCSAWGGSKMLYNNDDHLNPDGGAVVVRELLRQLR